MTTNTNIKNLPENRTYFTERMYSDSSVWVEISRSASGKTITLAKVDVSVDPEWTAKRQTHSGGFCAHVSNQHEQTWLFKEISETMTTKIRQTNKGWTHQGVKFTENLAWNFHDYNF